MYMNVDLQTKSGEIRSVINSFTFLTIKNQRYLLSVATDITEHKRAEEALQKSAEEYQYIINTSLDGFSRTRPGWKIHRCKQFLLPNVGI